MSNGKGDSPRNCFSQQYRDHFDKINWAKKKEEILKDDVRRTDDAPSRRDSCESSPKPDEKR